MSIAAELRLKRRGQLDKLKTDRDDLTNKANDALLIVLMKADSLADIATLDTAAIHRAADTLHESVRAVKSIDQQIAAINQELYG